LHIAFRESIGYTARDGNGRERLDIVRDGTRAVFNLIATRGNGTGMDLSQRDGTGLIMIFIPVSLSTIVLRPSVVCLSVTYALWLNGAS